METSSACTPLHTATTQDQQHAIVIYALHACSLKTKILKPKIPTLYHQKKLNKRYLSKEKLSETVNEKAAKEAVESSKP
jgi:hypothetical protein